MGEQERIQITLRLAVSSIFTAPNAVHSSMFIRDAIRIEGGWQAAMQPHTPEKNLKIKLRVVMQVLPQDALKHMHTLQWLTVS